MNAIAIASKMQAANIGVATTSGRRIFADLVQLAPHPDAPLNRIVPWQFFNIGRDPPRFIARE
jgi:hypothetical protein